MTYEEWVDTYKPIKNSIDDNASYDGTMFETYGDELAQVRKAWEANPNTVWTLLEEDDYLWIGAGYHWVNRLGYFITEQHFLDEFLEIHLGGPDDFADDEDESRCATEGCTEDPNDGEGYDGYCGNCADRREAAGVYADGA